MYVENTTDYDTVYPGDYFYYDGNRVIEHHKHQVVEEPPWPPAMKTMASDTANDQALDVGGLRRAGRDRTVVGEASAMNQRTGVDIRYVGGNATGDP
jgi:hypothetical protein